jgi:hypothetical protein
MSYEDLNKARAARAAKNEAAAHKGKVKRGRKRKVLVREAEGDVDGDAQEVGPSAPVVKSKEKKARFQGPKPWSAPVAMMYKGSNVI